MRPKPSGASPLPPSAPGADVKRKRAAGDGGAAAKQARHLPRPQQVPGSVPQTPRPASAPRALCEQAAATASAAAVDATATAAATVAAAATATATAAAAAASGGHDDESLSAGKRRPAASWDEADEDALTAAVAVDTLLNATTQRNWKKMILTSPGDFLRADGISRVPDDLKKKWAKIASIDGMGQRLEAALAAATAAADPRGDWKPPFGAARDTLRALRLGGPVGGNGGGAETGTAAVVTPAPSCGGEWRDIVPVKVDASKAPEPRSAAPQGLWPRPLLTAAPAAALAPGAFTPEVAAAYPGLAPTQPWGLPSAAAGERDPLRLERLLRDQALIQAELAFETRRQEVEREEGRHAALRRLQEAERVVRELAAADASAAVAAARADLQLFSATPPCPSDAAPAAAAAAAPAPAPAAAAPAGGPLPSSAAPIEAQEGGEAPVVVMDAGQEQGSDGDGKGDGGGEKEGGREENSGVEFLSTPPLPSAAAAPSGDPAPTPVAHDEGSADDVIFIEDDEEGDSSDGEDEEGEGEGTGGAGDGGESGAADQTLADYSNRPFLAAKARDIKIPQERVAPMVAALLRLSRTQRRVALAALAPKSWNTVVAVHPRTRMRLHADRTERLLWKKLDDQVINMRFYQLNDREIRWRGVRELLRQRDGPFRPEQPGIPRDQGPTFFTWRLPPRHRSFFVNSFFLQELMRNGQGYSYSDGIERWTRPERIHRRYSPEMRGQSLYTKKRNEEKLLAAIAKTRVAVGLEARPDDRDLFPPRIPFPPSCLLTDFDKVIFAVHSQAGEDVGHWGTAVIYIEARRIVYFDSSGNRPEEIMEGLREWIYDEACQRLGRDRAYFYHKWPIYYPELPRQTNDHDCGLFALLYADAASRDKECGTRAVSYTQRDIEQFRLRLIADLVMGTVSDCPSPNGRGTFPRQ